MVHFKAAQPCRKGKGEAQCLLGATAVLGSLQGSSAHCGWTCVIGYRGGGGGTVPVRTWPLYRAMWKGPAPAVDCVEALAGVDVLRHLQGCTESLRRDGGNGVPERVQCQI
jgi:hypothetical protein